MCSAWNAQRSRQIEPGHQLRQKRGRTGRAIVAVLDERARSAAVALNVVAVVAEPAKAEHVLHRQPDDAGDRISGDRAQHDDGGARHTNSPAAGEIRAEGRRSRRRICTSYNCA